MNRPILFTFLTLTAAAGVVSCSKSNQADKTFTEAADPIVLNDEQLSAWELSGDGLNAAWGDADVRYGRSVVPVAGAADTMKLTAWKGEKESAQLVLWTRDGADGVTCEVNDFVSPAGKIPATAAQARFVRYTIADTTFSVNGAEILVADMIDSIACMNLDPKTARPVWVSIEVPADAAAGLYDSEVIISSNDKGKTSLPIRLEVIDRTLPPASEWAYHLDLWQHPTAVARAYGLEVWSDEHFEAMKPLMQMLADAGQKVITGTLNKDPWNHQCYDGYENMIKWTLNADGTWSYDYAAFDRWVQMMMDLGIDKMINCYSMVPWNCELEYYDQASDSVVTVTAEPGTEIFVNMWKPFLADFKKHLDEKGWLPITNIAMDERDPESMDAAARLLEECAPEMGFAIADNHQSYKKYTMMRDVCVSQAQTTDHEDIVDRRSHGFNTTFYVCCGPLFPNTFTYSDPYEAELLGWYGIALDYDGMLRWAYNS
ncbi:MAG: hypothetical protein K2G40_01455, partial [Muribaculaceae bacterium]|nr:hypothetical protein [Muribaculaceae bacterium]